MNILSIIGTRPNVLKIDKDLPQQICWSGQHHSTLLKDVFFSGLEIPKPHFELEETKLEKMIGKMRKIIRQENPTCVLVYGDTRSSLAGAIAAKEEKVRIAHVEAGMRCYRASMIEETNRVIIDHMSDILFAATSSAVANLAKEHLKDGVYLTGNVLFDTFGSQCPIKQTEDHGKYSYLTIHRQANLEKTVLMDIFDGLAGEEQIRFPVHPHTEKVLKQFKIKLPDNIIKLPPVSYIENLTLISNARMVVTDSGGVQCEAYWMRRPCLVLRKETEWTEYVEDGWIKLVGHDAIDIMKEMRSFDPHLLLQKNYPEPGAKKRIREILWSL